MPQRSETVVYVTCIVYATAMTLRIYFLLRYSFQPAKHKEQLGQKNQTCVFISNFPAARFPAARDAYCALCLFHLVLSQCIVHRNQRFFVKLPMTRVLHGTWWSSMSNIFILAYGYVGLIDLQRLFVESLFFFIRRVSFCFAFVTHTQTSDTLNVAN